MEERPYSHLSIDVLDSMFRNYKGNHSLILQIQDELTYRTGTYAKKLALEVNEFLDNPNQLTLPIKVSDKKESSINLNKFPVQGKNIPTQPQKINIDELPLEWFNKKIEELENNKIDIQNILFALLRRPIDDETYDTICKAQDILCQKFGILFTYTDDIEKN